MKEKLRWIPPVHDLQKEDRFEQISEQLGDKELATDWLREELEMLRGDMLSGNSLEVESADDIKRFLFNRMLKRYKAFEEGRLRRVINATGTVLHTNLGRANVSEAAVEKVVMAARHYTNLEYDITSGRRGSRHAILEDLVKEATGAEAAMVVNNNAAAVYLVLKAFASGKEVVVSRGQLVEIGGSFRVSSIMEESGAHLVEVGTTNKTHKKDYEEAIHDETAMLMKVHTSNFKTVGFTSEVSLREMAEVAKRKEGILVYEDLGSGALYDFKQHGIGDEPTISETIRDGADLVTFSGDKLLGGPQAGIIAGKKKWIDQLKKHQLARVLRVDKMTLAALEETLQAYVKGKSGVYSIPTVNMVLATKESIEKRASTFLENLTLLKWRAFLDDDVSKVGGGTMPEVTLPTVVVCIDTGDMPVQWLVDALRTETNPPIIVRAKEEKVLLDFRTITEEEQTKIAEAIMEIESRLLNQ